MHINLIWAQDQNVVIGKNGKLPLHVSEDLKNFKKVTLYAPIVMGRKTWDSLPLKPLPKRDNIVLSSTPQNLSNSFLSLDACLDYLNDVYRNQQVFIIGGRSIYKLFFAKAKVLHITFINLLEPEIDEFFPISNIEIKKYFQIIKKKELSNNATYTVWHRF